MWIYKLKLKNEKEKRVLSREKDNLEKRVKKLFYLTKTLTKK